MTEPRVTRHYPSCTLLAALLAAATHAVCADGHCWPRALLCCAVLETVARVKNKKNEIKEEKLISDLVVVIVSATYSGIAFACAGQLVETVAQFGVIFLLFALDLEFSMAKLRVFRAVAILGGLLQISLFMCLCGIIASVRLIVMKMISYVVESLQKVYLLCYFIVFTDFKLRGEDLFKS
ncbi:K(+) efflux antiporter 4 [Citrus sinensis]|nr:K(+) efflux antiporter 4 [Citrus sinensis]